MEQFPARPHRRSRGAPRRQARAGCPGTVPKPAEEAGSRSPWQGVRKAEGRENAAARQMTRHGLRSRCSKTQHSKTPHRDRTHRSAVPYASRHRGPTTLYWNPHRNQPRTALAQSAKLPQPPSHPNPIHPHPHRHPAAAHPPPPVARARGRPRQAAAPTPRRSWTHPASPAHSTRPTHSKYSTHQACSTHSASSGHPSKRNPEPDRKPRQHPKCPLTQPPPKLPSAPNPPQNQNAVGPSPRPLPRRPSAAPPSPSRSPNSSRSCRSFRSPDSRDSPTPAAGAAASNPPVRGRVALPCSCTPRFLVPGPPFVRTRAGVLLPVLVYGPASTPLSPGTTQKNKDTRTKSSRARIPAAADRHPGRGRTTGGVSSVRARHSTG